MNQPGALTQVASMAALLGMINCAGNVSQDTPVKAYLPSAIIEGQLAQSLDTYMSRITPFGFAGALLVAKEGRVILNQGYGLAVRSASIPNTTETAFSIEVTYRHRDHDTH